MRDTALLVLLLAAAFALRAGGLGQEELSTDEAFSWRIATYGPAEIVSRTAQDVHPPLYYLVLHGWMAAAGESAAALRALSLLLGLGVVGLAWAVARETGRFAGAGTGPAPRGAALLSAALVVLHADQVEHSRHVRMYTLGASLAALSAWLLLRALRGGGRARAWWAGYALSAAALGYTHYYGAFTVAAQLAFAGAMAWREWRAQGVARPGLGWAGAVALVAGLYAPWVPVVLRQTGRVSEQYWIGDQDTSAIAAAVLRWATGFEWAPPLPLLALAALGLAAGWSFRRGDRGQRLLLLQAVVPWMGAFLLSALAGRWLLLERYLFFSQLALLVFLARAWEGLVSAWARRAVALALSAALAVPLAGQIGARPAGEGAAVQAARLLADSVRPGDLLLANAPRDLLVLRHHLARAGGESLEMRCPASRSTGHLSQAAALAEGEVIADERVWDGPWPRVWFVRLHPTRRWRPDPPPTGWRETFTRVIDGPGRSRALVMAFERE